MNARAHAEPEFLGAILIGYLDWSLHVYQRLLHEKWVQDVLEFIFHAVKPKYILHFHAESQNTFISNAY